MPIRNPSTYGFTHSNAYQVALATGNIAAGVGAASEILQVRWTAPATGTTGKLCALQEISVTGIRASIAFAVGNIDLTTTIARAFTAAGTGGTTATLTTNNAKLITSYATSSMGEIRIATTAALTAGTKTLDAADIGGIVSHSSGGTGAATPIIGNIYLPSYTLFADNETDNEGPVILAANEGVVVRATVPGTGVWNIGFLVKWIEYTRS